MPLAEPELNRLVAFALDMADEAKRLVGQFSARPPTATLKPDRGFVTDLDRAIEAGPRLRIAAAFPRHGVIGEEERDVNLDAEFVWVLDPIDCAAPFIAGSPVWGTLIALAVAGIPVIGVIDLHATPNRWLGAVGRPTQHGDRVCRTRACATLDGAILSASNPARHAKALRLVDAALEVDAR